MLWNKQQHAAPPFIWDAGKLLKAEWIFLAEAGASAGAAKRLSAARQSELAVDALAADAACTLEIEGEFLEKSLIAAGIRRQLGLSLQHDDGNPVADGCARLALESLRGYSTPVDLEWLRRWREFFWNHYRQERLTAPSLAGARRRDLQRCLHWFNAIPEGEDDSPLVRAGLAHLWFESIHPLPVGSGILGRHLAQRVLTGGLPNHGFTPLDMVLLNRRTEYLRVLDEACRDHNATQWLLWFAAAAIEAGRLAKARVELAVNQERLLESLRDHISGRQQTMLGHFFRLGDGAFVPGVSPAQYAAFSGQPVKTVAADMANLVAAKALTRSVRARNSRYHLALPSPEVRRVDVEDIL